MREIKFKAWDKKYKKMYHGGNIRIALAFPDENIEFMQYTGLKDKNGLTELYEGDIIGLDGLKRGNIYEDNDLLEEKSNLVIRGFGTSTWETTNKEAMERGCKYSE